MKRLAWMTTLLLTGLVLIGIGLLYLGVYNVAATKPHYWVTWWILDTAKQYSVERHAKPVPAADGRISEAAAWRGAGPYRVSCQPCHGWPGGERGELGQGLNPPPPDLRRSSARWRSPELFWITKHGIKFTGMPAWNWLYRDDEIWSLVAYIEHEQDGRRRLAAVEGAADFQSLPPGATAPEIATRTCDSCHGGLGKGRGEVPRLAGQFPEYLAASLRRYARGSRPSGIMAPVARSLSEPQIEALARHYAALAPRETESAHSEDGDASAGRAVGLPSASGLVLQTGGAIAAVGVRDVRACSSCHTGQATADAGPVPKLDGQPRAYLILQLQLWKTGVRKEPPMRAIAAQLTDREIEAVAEYYARRP